MVLLSSPTIIDRRTEASFKRSVGKGKKKKNGKEQQVLSPDNEHCSCREHPPLFGPPSRSHRVDLFALIVAIPSPEGKRERECDAG